MTAASRELMTDFAGSIPVRGTFPIAADTLIRKGWLVGLDSAGRVVAGDTIANGCLCGIGKASATYDNRVGAKLPDGSDAGAAGALNVEVEYGVFGYVSKTGGGDDIAADDIGKVCFVVDNATVALTSNSSARGIAGFIADVQNGKVYVWMGPHVKGEIVIAAAVASDVSDLQTDMTAAQTDITNLQTDAGVGFHGFSLYDFHEVDSNGDVGAITANGGVLASDTTPILRGDANETTEIVWATGNVDPISTQIVLPPDFKGAANATVDLWVRSGTTDAATFTVESGWDGGALVSDSASDSGTKSATLHKITATIAAADIPDTARLLTLTLTPTNAHATDTYGLLGVGLNFTRVQS